MPLLAMASAAALGAGAHGTFHRNSPIFGRTLSRLPGRERQLALTFDDGPNPDATPRVLDILARFEVRATFFVLGRHARRWPALVRRVVDEGHQVGNHGFAHRRLHLAGPARARGDLSDGTAAIIDACGVAPRHFRAPHGFRSPFVSAAARRLSQRTVGWSLGVWDSARPGTGEIARRLLVGVGAGSIVLLHDGDGYNPFGDRRQTAEALERVIPILRDRGYALVTLPE
jgi:peptidoglycan-N-acetylglucosamine deacetylase